jgi:hypothetical protein
MSSGNLAILTAIRRASSRGSSALAGLAFEIDIRKHLSAMVADADGRSQCQQARTPTELDVGGCHPAALQG